MKEYVDWEIEAIIEKLLNIAEEKGYAFNEKRRHHALDPLPNARESAVEWMGVAVIRQLQAQLNEALKLKPKLEIEPEILALMQPKVDKIAIKKEQNEKQQKGIIAAQKKLAEIRAQKKLEQEQLEKGELT